MMNTFIIVNITPLLPYVRDSLEEKSMLKTSKEPSLSLHLGIDLKEELTAYWFVLKATSYPIPTQVEQTEDGEHFAND